MWNYNMTKKKENAPGPFSFSNGATRGFFLYQRDRWMGAMNIALCEAQQQYLLSEEWCSKIQEVFASQMFFYQPFEDNPLPKIVGEGERDNSSLAKCPVSGKVGRCPIQKS